MTTSTLIEFTFEDVPGISIKAEADALIQEARQLPAVSDGDIVYRASIDPTAIKAWLEVATLGLTLLTTLVTLVRQRQFKGVKIRVKGAELALDQATPADLERILSVINATPAGDATG